MRGMFKILTFILFLAGFIFARGNDIDSEKSAISIKINQYYFDIGDDDDLLKKRSHKRRKIKRKPRRGRDNR